MLHAHDAQLPLHKMIRSLRCSGTPTIYVVPGVDWAGRGISLFGRSDANMRI